MAEEEEWGEGSVWNPFGFPFLVEEIPHGEELADELCQNALELRKFDKDGVLLSDDWLDRKRAESEEDYERSGYSSFANHNLVGSHTFQLLHEELAKAVNRYLTVMTDGNPEKMPWRYTNSWVSIYSKGHWVPEHTHPLCHLSLVFYGNRPDGSIIFKNPALPTFASLYGGPCQLFNSQLTLEPKRGTVIVFPSVMPHGTRPNNTDQERIIFSANMTFTNCPELGSATN